MICADICTSETKTTGGDLLLISLHSRHARDIVDSRKKMELRKRPPREQVEPYVLFYECVPTGAIVGMFKIKEVVCGDATFFAENHRVDLCLTRKSIEDYLGEKKGYGIVIDSVFELPNVPLEDMKKAGILPPQGYRYLTKLDLDQMGILFCVDKIVV